MELEEISLVLSGKSGSPREVAAEWGGRVGGGQFAKGSAMGLECGQSLASIRS